jgi:hypothetical protein
MKGLETFEAARRNHAAGGTWASRGAARRSLRGTRRFRRRIGSEAVPARAACAGAPKVPSSLNPGIGHDLLGEPHRQWSAPPDGGGVCVVVNPRPKRSNHNDGCSLLKQTRQQPMAGKASCASRRDGRSGRVAV